MTARKLGVSLLVSTLLTGVLWKPTANLFASWRAYRQAEPVTQYVWHLAGAMRRFSEVHQRSPENLDEVALFEPYEDFSTLRPFPHQFYASGPTRFYLRVNARYHFIIDEAFRPERSQDYR